jgi:hypothetical protein
MYWDWETSELSIRDRPSRQTSRFLSPVLFLKYRMARVGFPAGGGAARCLGRKSRRPMATTTTPNNIERGIKSFFRLTVRVIGFEVAVFLFGTGRSAVGTPF